MMHSSPTGGSWVICSLNEALLLPSGIRHASSPSVTGPDPAATHQLRAVTQGALEVCVATAAAPHLVKGLAGHTFTTLHAQTAHRRRAQVSKTRKPLSSRQGIVPVWQCLAAHRSVSLTHSLEHALGAQQASVHAVKDGHQQLTGGKHAAYLGSLNCRVEVRAPQYR